MVDPIYTQDNHSPDSARFTPQVIAAICELPELVVSSVGSFMIVSTSIIVGVAIGLCILSRSPYKVAPNTLDKTLTKPAKSSNPGRIPDLPKGPVLPPLPLSTNIPPLPVIVPERRIIVLLPASAPVLIPREIEVMRPFTLGVEVMDLRSDKWEVLLGKPVFPPPLPPKKAPSWKNPFTRKKGKALSRGAPDIHRASPSGGFVHSSICLEVLGSYSKKENLS